MGNKRMKASSTSDEIIQRTIKFEALPFDVLFKIFSLMSAEDVSNLRNLNRFFRNVVLFYLHHKVKKLSALLPRALQQVKAETFHSLVNLDSKRLYQGKVLLYLYYTQTELAVLKRILSRYFSESDSLGSKIHTFLALAIDEFIDNITSVTDMQRTRVEIFYSSLIPSYKNWVTFLDVFKLLEPNLVSDESLGVTLADIVLSSQWSNVCLKIKELSGKLSLNIQAFLPDSISRKHIPHLLHEDRRIDKHELIAMLRECVSCTNHLYVYHQFIELHSLEARVMSLFIDERMQESIINKIEYIYDSLHFDKILKVLNKESHYTENGRQTIVFNRSQVIGPFMNGTSVEVELNDLSTQGKTIFDELKLDSQVSDKTQDILKWHSGSDSFRVEFDVHVQLTMLHRKHVVTGNCCKYDWYCSKSTLITEDAAESSVDSETESGYFL